MGKGWILSHAGDGLYQLRILYNRDLYDARMTALENSLAEQQAALAKDPDNAMLKLAVAAVDLEIRTLTANMPEDPTVAAWCADLSENLSGEVGTVEIPGESIQFQIQPGYGGHAAYDRARDGQLIPTISMHPPQALYNLAMMPGWQKWKPLFRHGTITALDGDSADVALESAASSQQGLDINQTTTLSGVAIEYMSCNGGAFDVGDEVLIRFDGQDWSRPRIVGFKEHPKPCDVVFFIRPRFNGHLARLGNEEISFTLAGAGNFAGTVFGLHHLPGPEFALDDVMGLCGPFTVGHDVIDALSGPVDVRLKNDLAGTYFNANVLHTQGKYIALTQYFLSNPLEGVPATGAFTFQRPAYLSLFARYDILDHVVTDLDFAGFDTLEISGRSYRVYDVRFDDLNKIRASSNYEDGFTYPYVFAKTHGYSVFDRTYAFFTPNPRYAYVPYGLIENIPYGPSFKLLEERVPYEMSLWLMSDVLRFIPGGSTSVYETGWTDDIADYAQGLDAFTIWTDARGQNPRFRPSTLHANFNIAMYMDEVVLDGSYVKPVEIPGYPHSGTTNWNFGRTISMSFEMVAVDQDVF